MRMYAYICVSQQAQDASAPKVQAAPWNVPKSELEGLGCRLCNSAFSLFNRMCCVCCRLLERLFVCMCLRPYVVRCVVGGAHHGAASLARGRSCRQTQLPVLRQGSVPQLFAVSMFFLYFSVA